MAKKLKLKLQPDTVEVTATAVNGVSVASTFQIGFRCYERAPANEKFEVYRELAVAGKEEELDSFIQNEIVYLRNLVLSDEEGEEVLLKDSRDIAELERLFGVEASLHSLTALLLSSNPYRRSILESWTSSVFNLDFKSNELKN